MIRARGQWNGPRSSWSGAIRKTYSVGVASIRVVGERPIGCVSLVIFSLARLQVRERLQATAAFRGPHSTPRFDLCLWKSGMERVANQEWIKEMANGKWVRGGKGKGMDSAL